MCSSTSDVTTASNEPSGNGSMVASPRRVPTKLVLDLTGFGHGGERGLVPTTSSAAWSRAMTRWPRRANSKACRPNPAPASSTRPPGAQPEIDETVEADGQHRVGYRPLRRDLGQVVGHGEHLTVLLDGELGAAPPRPAFDHSLRRPAAPIRARSSGSSRPRRMSPPGAPESPARHCSTVSPSVPVTSGSAPPSVATRVCRWPWPRSRAG